VLALKEVRVEPQPGDETDVTANCGDQIERRETGVGDDDDLAIRQPSPNLENGLAGPNPSASCDGDCVRRGNVWRGPEWSGRATPSAAASMEWEPWP